MKPIYVWFTIADIIRAGARYLRAGAMLCLALVLAALLWIRWQQLKTLDYWLPKIYAELQDANPLNENIWTGRIGDYVE